MLLIVYFIDLHYLKFNKTLGKCYSMTFIPTAKENTVEQETVRCLLFYFVYIYEQHLWHRLSFSRRQENIPRQFHIETHMDRPVCALEHEHTDRCSLVDRRQCMILK